MQRTILALLLICSLSLSAVAKGRKDVPLAPLPTQVTTAKKVFILKGVGATAHTVEGGYDLAFDAFYSQMKTWGRYELTDRAENADLVMEVTYDVTDHGTRVYSSTNSYTHQTTIHSSQAFSGQLTLVVYEAQTRAELWSTSVKPGVALLKSNQEKEMIIAGQKLATNLAHRMPVETK
jgi:hypothetical protein